MKKGEVAELRQQIKIRNEEIDFKKLEPFLKQRDKLIHQIDKMKRNFNELSKNNIKSSLCSWYITAIPKTIKRIAQLESTLEEMNKYIKKLNKSVVNTAP